MFDASLSAKIGFLGGADASSLLVKVDLLRRTITSQRAIAEDLARKAVPKSCKSIVQHPAPATHEECSERAANLQQILAGTIDDAGYSPVQITCMYAYPDWDSE